MRLNIHAHQILIAALLSTMCAAQNTSTAPAGQYRWTQVNDKLDVAATSFDMILEPANPNLTPSRQELDAFVRVVRQQFSNETSFSTNQYNRLFNDWRATFVVTLHSAPLPASADETVQSIIQSFNNLLANAPTLSVEDRTSRLKHLDQQEAALSDQRRAIAAIQDAQGNGKSLLSEKLAQLRSARQRLAMELAAKESRRTALSVALKQEQARAGAQTANDAIARELQTVIKAREAAVTIARQRSSAAVAGSGGELALNEAETSLAEAKIRLAERQAEVGKSGKGDLVDRLSDELAMVSVDATDLQIQLERVSQELSGYDVTAMNSESVNAMLQRDPSLRNPTQPAQSPALAEITEKQGAIYIERFKLMVKNVTAVPSGGAGLGPNGNPWLNPGARGTRGGRGLAPTSAPATP